MPPKRAPEAPHAAPDLFGQPHETSGEAPASGPGATRSGGAPVATPLADRLRPRRLAEVVGQDHLLGPQGSLRRMLDRGALAGRP